MKKLVLASLVAGALLSAEGGGFYFSASVPFYPSGCYYPYAGFSYSYYYPAYTYPSYPAYPYVYTRPNYAVEGTMLGAWTGGVIGSTQCQGWQGAAIGAAAGLVLGGIAEAATQKQERNWAYVPPPPAAPQVAVSQPPQATPSPNQTAVPPKSLHQIPDAPRVPDAPTF